MSETRPPLLIEPDTLDEILDRDDLLVIDLSKADTYRKLHAPGAVHLDYGLIIASERPVMGLVPDDATLDKVFSAAGIDAQTHVVAYDDEGGGKAARLLYTLEIAGHEHFSLLNGGLHAWANEGHRVVDAPVTPAAKQFSTRRNNTAAVDSAYIRNRLDNPDTRLLDVRSPDEYRGAKKFAERAGHIPGAVNLEWTQAMDQGRNLRFKPDAQLLEMLAAIDVKPEHEIITYCQTHHRSAHTYVVLKHLGFEQVKGYPGSWSDWGNDADLPVEV